MLLVGCIVYNAGKLNYVESYNNFFLIKVDAVSIVVYMKDFPLKFFG